MEIVRDFDVDAYWNKKEDELNRLPKCKYCGEPIQTEQLIRIDYKEYCCLDCEDEYARDFWFDFARYEYLESTLNHTEEDYEYDEED